MIREMKINCLTYNRGTMRHKDHLTASEDDAQVVLNIIEGTNWANIYLSPDSARQLAVWLIHSAGKIEDRHPEMITSKETA